MSWGRWVARGVSCVSTREGHVYQETQTDVFCIVMRDSNGCGKSSCELMVLRTGWLHSCYGEKEIQLQSRNLHELLKRMNMCLHVLIMLVWIYQTTLWYMNWVWRSAEWYNQMSARPLRRPCQSVRRDRARAAKYGVNVRAAMISRWEVGLRSHLICTPR